MNIKVCNGCTTNDIIVDGKSINDIENTNYIVEHLVSQIIPQIKEGAITLEQLIELFQYDDYKCDGEPCDTCGDTYTITEYNI